MQFDLIGDEREGETGLEEGNLGGCEVGDAKVVNFFGVFEVGESFC